MVTREACFVITLIMFSTDKRTSLPSLSPLFQRKIYSLSCLIQVPKVKLLHDVLNLLLVDFYGFVNLRVIFNNTCRVKSFFPIQRPFQPLSKIENSVQGSFWDCDSFYVGKPKRRLHDRKNEHFKTVTHASALADHVTLLVTTSNGTILISSLLEGPTYSAKLKKFF